MVKNDHFDMGRDGRGQEEARDRGSRSHFARFWPNLAHFWPKTGQKWPNRSLLYELFGSGLGLTTWVPLSDQISLGGPVI